MNTLKELATSFGLLWLRVLTGAGIATHGYGKLFTPGRMDGFAKGVADMGIPMPEVFAWAAALSEFAGGLLLILGLATRPAALLVFLTMTVAAFLRHGDDPFSKKELALAYWVLSGAILCLGAGAWSVDRLIAGRRKTSSESKK